jgi:hypothetical protein
VKPAPASRICLASWLLADDRLIQHPPGTAPQRGHFCEWARAVLFYTGKIC